VIYFIFLLLLLGTFVYISASEVIVEEFEVKTYKYLKFLFLIVGAGAISLLTLIE
jgi:hypothetical protein